jgi:hypothetical protein
LAETVREDSPGERSQFSGSFATPTEKSLVDQAGKLAEVNRQDLKAGDVVILKKGDVAPAGETLANRLTELYTAAFARPDADSQALRLAELLATPIILAGVAALRESSPEFGIAPESTN